jgi:hypothetical protein
MTMLRRGAKASQTVLLVFAVASTVLASIIATGSSSANATSPANEGVTSKTINIGIPYVNFAALAKSGVNINEGNIPDAYNALIGNMNDHGGVDGWVIAGSVAGRIGTELHALAS